MRRLPAMAMNSPYDAATKTYHIPVAGVDQLYTAQIYEIEKKGATTYLTVGYIAGGQWVQDANGDIVAPEPDKYMKITLREKGESYYISAIQATDPPETAATKAQPSETEGETVSEAPASSEGGFLYCGGNHCYRTEYCRVRGGKLKKGAL